MSSELPTLRLSELSLLPPSEQRRILVDWNQTDHWFPRDTCLHRLIEDQVERTPGATAVACEGRSLSYRQLDERANRLAGRLLRLGVGVEDRVAISLRRSFEMVVGLLGILKAGAAYVPLDPDYPPDRLAFLLGDCSPAAVLTTADVAGRLPAHAGATLLLGPDGDPAGGGPAPRVAVTAENLAYVIYTSGSTGRPKGAGNTHRAVVNRLDWMRRHYGVGPADHVLHKTPFSFDVSVWELFLPLLAGARLVLAGPEDHRDVARLVDIIERERVTMLHFVPSLLELFLEAESIERCDASLRLVVASGEVLPVPLQQRFFARLGAELHNLYGPTEAAIDVTCWQCSRDPGGKTVPIGRPISNVRIYLLDGALRPVPVGSSGELYIGGVAPARGYLGRPELTAERFLPDPHGGDPGARLYRTGDLARYRADGNIEFQGRIDHQIKLRGYRIELGEIEAVLAEHPLVRQAVVDCRVDHQGHRRLVAWLVLAGGEGAQGSTTSAERALRRHAGEKLADYMIPSAFVLLERLPRNPSGKVDRKALPEPDLGRRPAESYVAPRTAVEAALTRIWSELLPVGRIGVEDNFFEIGGDSIISIQVVARARRQGIELQVNEIFRSPTIAGLAALAANAASAAAQAQAASPPTAAVPATPSERALLARGLATGDEPCLGLVVSPAEPLDAGRLAAALRVLAGWHDALRYRYLDDGHGGWVREVAEAGAANAPLLQEPELGRVLAAAGKGSREPLLRAAAGRLAIGRGSAQCGALLTAAPDGSDRLLLVVHAAAMDQASWPLLLRDLERAYRDAAPPAAAPAPSPAAFGVSQPLPRETPALSAPADGSPGDQRRRARCELDAGETRRWLAAAPAAFRARPEEILLAAVARALGGDDGEAPRACSLWQDGRAGAGPPAIGLPGEVVLVRLPAPPPQSDGGRWLLEVKECVRAARRRAGGGETPAAGEPWVAVSLLDLRAEALPRGGLFAADGEPFGADAGELALPPASLRIVARATSRGTAIQLEGEPRRFSAPDLERTARALRDRLLGLVADCCRPGAFGYSPADFPLARLEQRQIDRLFAATPGIEDAYPLSSMQAGLLFRSLYLPASDSYLNQNVVEILGPADVGLLRQAWQEVVAHYTVLRTAFVYEDTLDPLQFVNGSVEVPWTLHDWRGRPEAQWPAALVQLLADDRKRPFDLGRAPLLRLAWVQLAPERGYLMWSHHHILVDGWCLALIWGNFFAAYAQLKATGTVALAPSRPYRDYIEWLERQEVSGSSETFWREYLAGFARITGFSRSELHADGDYDTRVVELPPARTDDLRRLAQRFRVTLNSFVQAVWSLLLWRYSGQTDIVFGVSVSGRPVELAGVEDMVGLFINTLPLRVRLDPAAELPAFLRALQENMVRINEHAYVPLARIKSWCEASGGAGKPIFETLIAFENYPQDKLPASRVADVEVRDLLAVEKTEYPMGMIVLPEDRLIFHLNYDTSHFGRDFVLRLGDQLTALLEGMLGDPEGSIGGFQLLHEAQLQQLAREWSDGPAAPPYEGIARRFERHAARDPHRPAVVDAAGGVTSYGELDAWADRLAGRLSRQGVGHESVVALLCGSSTGAVAGLLAAWKAGAAVLPLDPALPEARLAFMLADAAAVALLHAHDFAALAARLGVPALEVELASPAAPEAPAPVASAPELPDQLAYVMYTSGSTGQPKGVACTHRGLVNRIQWSLDLFAASAADSLLPIAAPGFDIALWEMLLPLLAGGRLVLADDRRRKDPVYLAERVEAEGVTLLHFVPSLLRTFVDLVPAGRCGSLRHVACGGEALAAGVSRRFLERFAARLHHWYGPTEAAISVTSWECRRDWAGGALPIGRPIAGARLAVLDEQLRPVPIGVAGEICLGGTPLARGYLGLPDVTAASWVPDPAPGAGGARLYRTGDLARILPDGQLEFAGRLDSQVKIRGHRAEPGEVEAVLLAHPGVAEAVVVAYEPRPEERLLAAYVRLEEERWDGEPRATRAAALERHARRSLPEALVPAPIVVLDRLPLLATGKVDRAALPRPQAAAPPAARVEPASPVELELARIWRDLLQVEEVGVHDSFFDLGGHSLLVISLVHRIAQSFGRARVLQITDIFKRPTIAELARAIEGTVDPRPDTLVALREEGSRIPLVLIHPSEGIVLAYRRLMDFLPDRPLYAINNPHLGDRERAFQSVEDMARCYLGYLRSHFPGDPVCLGGWSFGGVVALEMATQLEAAGDAVAALVLIDSFNFSAFDLEEPADGARWLLARRGIATDTAEGRELAFEIEHSGRLAACYRPGAYAGRVILLSAQHRDPQAAPSLDPYNGWRGVLGREPALYPLPAAHDQLLEPPWVERLAATLEEALADGENPAG